MERSAVLVLTQTLKPSFFLRLAARLNRLRKIGLGRNAYPGAKAHDDFIAFAPGMNHRSTQKTYKRLLRLPTPTMGRRGSGCFQIERSQTCSGSSVTIIEREVPARKLR